MKRLTGKSILSVVGGLLVLAAVLAFVVTKGTQAQPQQEILFSEEQQKLVKQMLEEKKRFNDNVDQRITGAIQMLMSQTEDPDTKKIGLDPAKWETAALDNGGFKMVRAKPQNAQGLSQPGAATAPTTQEAPK